MNLYLWAITVYTCMWRILGSNGWKELSRNFGVGNGCDVIEEVRLLKGSTGGGSLAAEPDAFLVDDFFFHSHSIDWFQLIG